MYIIAFQTFVSINSRTQQFVITIDVIEQDINGAYCDVKATLILYLKSVWAMSYHSFQ